MMLSQKSAVLGQDQKRCTSFSGSFLQKEQLEFSFTLILVKFILSCRLLINLGSAKLFNLFSKYLANKEAMK